MILTLGRSADIIGMGDFMNLRSILNEKNMSMYRLSQVSGVPKTTINDICSGKSSIAGCNAGTVLQLAKALGCTMEELMRIDTSEYISASGRPKSNTYLEKGLPAYLEQSLKKMELSWAQEDSGQKDLHWDITWCELNADINAAETEQDISHEQAQYLRKKYLRMENIE